MHAGAAHANCLPYSTVLVNEVMVPYHMQYQHPVLTCDNYNTLDIEAMV